MRRGLAVFLFINLIIVGFLLNSVRTLLSLLIEDGATDTIAREEISSPNTGLIDNPPQLIPKIIHQTYLNESIPAHWKGAQQSCIDLHEDYEYKVRRNRTCGNYQLTFVYSFGRISSLGNS